MIHDHCLKILVALGFVFLVVATPVSAQDEEATTQDDSQSGYSNIPEFGGPDGVSAELARNDQRRDSTFAFDGL